ncbi:hypothetical protein SIN01_11220 [Sporolactobacillus inulinus]|nr:hypothetical protein SIN01_11220 [Sporolactobacillus inulinus]
MVLQIITAKVRAPMTIIKCDKLACVVSISMIILGIKIPIKGSRTKAGILTQDTNSNDFCQYHKFLTM